MSDNGKQTCASGNLLSRGLKGFAAEPAFPCVDPGTGPWSGLTRIEWFAGQAAIGLLAMACNVKKEPPADLPDAMAEAAFDLAEALCAEAERRRK